MKQFLLCMLVAFVSYHLQSQDIGLNNNQIGISSNISFLSTIEGKTKSLFVDVSGGLEKVNISPDVERGYNIGITYHRFLTKKIKLITGIGYSEFLIIDHLKPSEDEYKEKLITISVPLLLRTVFKRDFFMEFGPIIEFDHKRSFHPFTDVQDGFGLAIAGGKEFKINNFSVEIYPNLELHSILPLKLEISKQKLLTAGIHLNLLYGF